MKRFASLVVAFFLLAAPVRAHFLWLLPADPKDEKSVPRLIFSDDLKPDSAELLKKVGKPALFARDLDLKTTELKLDDGKETIPVIVKGKGPLVIGGVCKYGVYQKDDKADPILVYYYAKTYFGEDLTKKPPKGLLDPWDKLPLEIVLLEKPQFTVAVLWKGKPLADAEVVLYVPGRAESVKGKTGADGQYVVKMPAQSGVYGLRASHTENVGGEFDGKKYTATRHHATLTFPVDKTK